MEKWKGGRTRVNVQCEKSEKLGLRNVELNFDDPEGLHRSGENPVSA